jgi:hypothetical protein
MKQIFYHAITEYFFYCFNSSSCLLFFFSIFAILFLNYRRCLFTGHVSFSSYLSSYGIRCSLRSSFGLVSAKFPSIFSFLLLLLLLLLLHSVQFLMNKFFLLLLNIYYIMLSVLVIDNLKNFTRYNINL